MWNVLFSVVEDEKRGGCFGSGRRSEKESELSRFCRELEREKMWSRIHLVPLLMAEGDRDMYRRQQSEYEREREIMKDVAGWKVSQVACFECRANELGSRLERVFTRTANMKRGRLFCGNRWTGMHLPNIAVLNPM
jgi:hypothetical protein